MRTLRQKQASERNFKVMRLRGMIANAKALPFTMEEYKQIIDSCNAALVRYGARPEYEHNNDQQTVLF